jgi:hypothetical protein
MSLDELWFRQMRMIESHEPMTNVLADLQGIVTKVIVIAIEEIIGMTTGVIIEIVITGTTVADIIVGRGRVTMIAEVGREDVVVARRGDQACRQDLPLAQCRGLLLDRVLDPGRLPDRDQDRRHKRNYIVFSTINISFLAPRLLQTVVNYQLISDCKSIPQIEEKLVHRWYKARIAIKKETLTGFQFQHFSQEGQYRSEATIT